MTRSIFDPTGGETERSGSPFLGPDPANISHLPPDVSDGEVGEEEVQDVEAAGLAAAEGPDEVPPLLATESADGARGPGESNVEAPGTGEIAEQMPPPEGA